jgi:hypothetical protein
LKPRIGHGTSEPDAGPSGELVLYLDEAAGTHLQVRLVGASAWLTQLQLAELYQTTVPNISQHLTELYQEGELDEGATIQSYLIVQQEGRRSVRRRVLHYNLDAIIAVGLRVRSTRGTIFRQWANERLREYIIKGFALDDQRLKDAGGGDYFDELLSRIRDIRSSERVFWRKVLDIYATSVDYDPSAEASQRFFQTVQNKMHWAAHGQTAAEVIYRRADAAKPNMGLTVPPEGRRIRQQDITVAKNYLQAEELDALNLIVAAYLDFAELQATSRRIMYMGDWIAKLDDFLRLSEREVLGHAGSISHGLAEQKAQAELEAFRKRQDALTQPVDGDFEAAIKRLAKPATRKKPKSDA